MRPGRVGRQRLPDRPVGPADRPGGAAGRCVIEAAPPWSGRPWSGPGADRRGKPWSPAPSCWPRPVVAEGTSLCNEIVSGERTNDVGRRRIGPPSTWRSARSDSCLSRQLVVADLPRQQRSRRRRTELAVKRLLDVTLAALGLLALLPLLLVAAVLVKITSPGPLFFIHRREGRDGREFGCIKFRTMVADAHKKQREMYGQNQVDGPQFKIDKDPRVTRIGQHPARHQHGRTAAAAQRAGRADEPGRPAAQPVPREPDLRRLAAGAAVGHGRASRGLWQICRDRDTDADFHQWIFYDLAYVKHFSLWLDAKILFWTIASLRRTPTRPAGKACAMAWRHRNDQGRGNQAASRACATSAAG